MVGLPFDRFAILTMEVVEDGIAHFAEVAGGRG
jgi:hypothetical protein